MTRQLSALLAVLALSVACGDDAPPARTAPPPPETANLEIVEPVGPVVRFDYGGSVDVKVKYTDGSGAVLAGYQVNFSTQGDSADSSLAAVAADTGTDGIATMTVRGGQRDADFTVVASALRAESVSLRVSVRTKDSGDLKVQLSYRGDANTLKTTTVGVFLGTIDCAVFDPSAATALGSKEVGAISERTIFTLGQGKDVSVFVSAKNDAGLVIAKGCNGGPVAIKGGATETVTIELDDIPPSYVGLYTVVSNFDFTQAMPPGVATFVNEMGGLFEDPGAKVLDWLEAAAGGFPPGFGAFKPAVAALITELFNQFTEGTTVGTVFTAGGEIHDLLSAMEIGSELEILEEPGADGKFPAGKVDERWSYLAIQWSAGFCEGNPPPEGCGRHEFSMDTILPDAIHATPDASVEDAWNLTIEPHGVTFDYGAVALFLIENVVLKLTLGYDSLQGFALELLGGEGCAGDGEEPDVDACCTAFSEAATENVTGRTILKPFCSVAVPAIDTLVRGWITGEQADLGENFQIGTKDDAGASKPCKLADDNGDLQVDRMGHTDADKRCEWFVNFKLNANADPVSFMGSWDGTRVSQ